MLQFPILLLQLRPPSYNLLTILINNNIVSPLSVPLFLNLTFFFQSTSAAALARFVFYFREHLEVLRPHLGWRVQEENF